MAPVREALAELLSAGQARLDPEGYLEVPLAELLARLPEPQPVDACCQAIRRLNCCFQDSPHASLRSMNFLRVRHLRSLSGETNIRVGIKLEAVTPFLQTQLKG
jgi:hypothetical protein